MYYVIHSKDPYLLARFCTELQMEGWPIDEEWCGYASPFLDSFRWLRIDQKFGMQFHKHDCLVTQAFTGAPLITLTSRNYTEVLEAVLTNKTK